MSARTADPINLNDYEIAILIIERDACYSKAQQIDELLNKIGQAKGFSDAANGQAAKPETKPQAAAAQEQTFSTLKFEVQQSEKMGEYEVAYKASNLEDKWRSANTILRNSNATIKDRYHGEGYLYSYWLYGEDKIYRQKLKPKA
jgi:hypothetical protein